MDKYTVDLDKVLNDFEYSELTDNFGSGRPYDAQTPSPYASSSKSKTGDARHSITNVFHSLNEYLNTDISVKITPTQIVNKEIVGNNYEIPVSSKAVEDKTKSENTTETLLDLSTDELDDWRCGRSAVKIDSVNLLDLDFSPESESVSVEKANGKCEEGGNESERKGDELRMDPKSDDKGKEPIKLEDYKVPEEDPIRIKCNNIEPITSQTRKPIAIADTCILENEPIKLKTNELEPIKLKEQIKFKDDEPIRLEVEGASEPNTSKGANLEQIALKDVNSEPIPSKDVKFESITLSNDEPIGFEGGDKFEPVTSRNAHAEPIISEQVTLEPITSKDVRLEPITSKDVKSEPITSKKSVILEPITFENGKFEQIDTQHNISEPIDSQHDTSEPITLQHDDKSELILSKDFVPITSQQDKNQSEKSISKQSTLEIDVNSKNVVSFDNTFDLDDSTLNEYLDELEQEYAQGDEEGVKEGQEEKSVPDNKTNELLDVESGESIELEIGDRKPEQFAEENVENPIEECVEKAPKLKNEEKSVEEDGVKVEKRGIEGEKAVEECVQEVNVERPKMLELDRKKSIEVVPQREINLIGNPGSTPYNNVYISKELQTAPSKNLVQKLKDEEAPSSRDDSETSPSISPTFSEASTEVLTDSSGSETEDDDMRTDAMAAKQNDANAAVAAKSEKQKKVDKKAALNASDLSNEPTTVANENATSIEMDNACALDVESGPIGDEGGATDTTNENVIGFWLGKEAPLWIPDSDALSCLHCDAKFTVIKRRHHCRACGLVLCSKCCNLKYKLEYLDAEARVCAKCYAILENGGNSSGSEASQANSPNRRPNPNNPMEYCSVVPPMQQVVGGSGHNPPTVMVPVGVLKRKGSNKNKSNKSVMFCDGIKPGSDLTTLDTDFNYAETANKNDHPPKRGAVQSVATPKTTNRNVPPIDPQTKCFISDASDALPPTVTMFKSDVTYADCVNGETIVETLKGEQLTFALQRNLYVHVKIINMDCCINKRAWCFSTDGLITVGQDEIVYVIELIDDEKQVPVDVFHHVNSIYSDAVKGTTVTEMGLSTHNTSNFLGFKNHAGFLYIRPTFQCLQNVIKPTEPYLIGLLIHRWETPWAKIFPLRLVLRLGAEYRYYPCPIISTRHRDSVFVEIGHTIINILADFRNFSYTLPEIRGLTIHMEDKNTTVTIPENRYDQVMRSLSNSSDHILAFGGNFSSKADSHLVCVQDTQASSENSYTTHAINILNKPRKVTGASFIVFNGALKSTSGLTAKSSIIEDGLMIQIPPEQMVSLRDGLRNMKNYTIQCGCVNAPSDETVNIVWGDPDTNFNTGVTSPIDNQSLSGVPSIRVHNGKDFVCNSGNKLIRWTEVFILQNTDEHPARQPKDPVDISKIAESVSKATCQALVKYLDLLTSNNFHKIAIRTNLHVENVSYSAGSNNVKLPPIYMKNLDNELIPVLHRITSGNLGDNAIVLELIFRILNT